MRILVTTQYYYPHTGGSQNYIAELYGNLVKNHRDIKVDVIAYNTDKTTKKEKLNGLNVYRVGCLEILPGQFAIPNYFELIQLLKKLKKNKYDVVNSHTRFFDNSWWSPLAAKYLGAKAVLTDHCAESPNHKSFLVRLVTKFVDRVIAPLAAHGYDSVISVSKATSSYLKSLGIKTDSIFYGGVDVEYFGKTKNKNKQNGDIVITFLGRMIPSKGPQILAEAMDDILREYKNTSFVFAGGGEMFDKLQIRYSSDRVSFLGKIDREQVRDLLANTDILVHPSIHHEGFPIVLLEAGASGCAVVATPQGGTTELIKNNDTGLISEATPDDIYKKIVKLVEDSKLRKRLAVNLQETIKEKYDWKTISNAYYEYLDNIV